MNKVQQIFADLSLRVDALSLRERLSIFTAMLLLTGGIWEATLAAPLVARRDAAQIKIENISKRLAQLDETIITTASALDGGVSDETDRLKLLRQQLAQSQGTIEDFTSDLIDPSQMRFVIEDLIRQQPNLNLVSAENLPVIPLIPTATDSLGSRGNAFELSASSTQLYRHSLVLQLEGQYLALIEYLSAIEALPWQIYWGRIELETLNHPQLGIQIEVNTLSLDAEWIGV